MRVSYDPTATTISCVYENQLDSSPKSCSIKYGVCGQEMSTTQGTTTVESPFMVILRLNSSTINPMNCYVVTASNETFTLMVKGTFVTQSNNDPAVNADIITGSVICVIILLGLVVMTATTIIVLVVRYQRKQQYGNQT